MNFKPLNVITGHVGAIYDVAQKEGVKAFTTSADKYVVRWDLNSGSQDKFAVKLDHSGFKIALSPSYNLLVIGNAKGGLHIIDLVSKKEVRFLTQHKNPIFSISFNEATNECYTGDAEGYFCVWDADSFDLKLTFPLNCGKIRNIAVKETGDNIAVCGQDGMVRIFETQFFNEIQKFKGHSTGVNCAVFNQDLLITGGKDAFITKWNWREGSKIKSIPAHNYAVYDLIFLKEKKILISASFDKTIKIWNSNSLDIIKRIEKKDGGHQHAVNRLAKINEEKFLSVSDDKQLILWG